MDIKEAIRMIAHQDTSAPIVLATVKSVEDDRSCTITTVESEIEISGVRLQAALSADSGVYFKPKVGSNVLVVASLYPFVCLTADTESVEINGSQFGGLTKTPELKSQLDKTNSLLQGIINVINGAPVTEPGNGAPSVLQISLKSAIAGKQLGSYDDIENENVKHG